MSILIKGMQMPKNCETCELFTRDSSGFFGCCVTGNIVMRKREQDRPSWCPLVELPPHGRLIDADALIKKMTEEGWADGCGWADALDLALAPTIIESEK